MKIDIKYKASLIDRKFKVQIIYILFETKKKFQV